MTEMEKLKTQLKTVIYREADGHHRHGAIVDALEAENARLRAENAGLRAENAELFVLAHS